MKNKFFLILFLINLTIFGFIFFSYINAQITGVPCVYTYSDWSPCSSSGTQTRTLLTTSPDGCYDSVQPILSQTCTYVLPAPSCVYTYSDWSPCSSSGTQTRTLLTSSPIGCEESPAPILSQACTYVSPSSTAVNCTYTYSEWGICNSSGIQVRSYVVAPDGCYQDEPPIIQQTCVYVIPSSTMVNCTYTYGDWGLCSSSGIQVRPYIAAPEGCYQESSPVVHQNCVYVGPYISSTTDVLVSVPDGTSTVPCVYTYNNWGSCDSSGMQTRSYTAVPEGCYQIEPPLIHQPCTFIQPILCTYDFSGWSACDSSGRQRRVVISKFPSGCSDATSPVLERTCAYIVPVPGTATDTEAELLMGTNVINACEYEYSAWSDCVNNIQTRMVISRSPQGCHEFIVPTLRQKCLSSPVIALPVPYINVPPPAPESILQPQPQPAFQPAIPAVAQPVIFNNRTSREWQKYYFGAENCLDGDVCGGFADPDNDGLNNNEEYRLGTNPKSADSDHDGYVDANEVEMGRDPLLAVSGTSSDRIVFENPRERGEIRKELFLVSNIEMVKTETATATLKISGKSLPDTYITIFIYSDPVVLTVKTDSDGNWSYVLDRPLENGKHEVYVAVTDNTGKITAKSGASTFVQTAEAATALSLAQSALEEQGAAPPPPEVSPTENLLKKNSILFFVLGFFGLFAALLAIGLTKMKNAGGDKPQ